jgi:hypothetical protein
MLKVNRVQRRRQRGDQSGLVRIAKVSADGAATKPEMLRWLGTDALAASTPEAYPFRRQEFSIKAPDRLAVIYLLHPGVHKAILSEPRSMEDANGRL